MIFTHKTKLNAYDIANKIETDAKQINLALKHTFPFSKHLPENGFEINEYVSVFEFCKINLAQRLLNSYPELSALMPCRISIYEKNKITYASTPDLTVQLNTLECDEDLKKDILCLYQDIKNMIEKW